MRRIFRKYAFLRFMTASLAIVSLAIAGLVACSDSTAGTSEDTNQVVASVHGVVEKGPFVKGSSVTLYELNPETMAQTGRNFAGTVGSDDGSFSFGKLELDSRYVLVDADGYYWNELYGSTSKNTLSLKSVAHIDEDGKINVNIATNIVYRRILSLVDSGMDFDGAKARAESELLEAFFGDESDAGSRTSFENASVFADAKLLALSVIVLMTGSEPEVTEMLADLSDGQTPKLLLKLADNSAFQYNDYFRARTSMENRFPGVSVPTFEAYICNFWQKVYGFETCTKEIDGTLDTVLVEGSSNAGKVAICKELEPGTGVYQWALANVVEQNTALIDSAVDGSLVKSESDSTLAFVYDDGTWRYAFDSEVGRNQGCSKAKDGSMIVVDHDVSRCDWAYCIDSRIKDVSNGLSVDSLDYMCSSRLQPVWTRLYVSETPKEYFFNDNVEYGTVTDERDGHTYRTVDIAGKTWMAENLSYLVPNANCRDSSTVGCKYSWTVATEYSGVTPVVGLCMDGWHIPDTTEWNALLNSNDLSSLVSNIGWTFGDNKTGLSLVPIGVDLRANASIGVPWDDFSYLLVVTALHKADGDYALFVMNKSVSFEKMYSTKLSQYIDYSVGFVRCVKDDE